MSDAEDVMMPDPVSIIEVSCKSANTSRLVANFIKAGGHRYGDVTANGTNMVTIGDVNDEEDSPTDAPSTSNHQYKDIRTSENIGLVVGNAGGKVSHTSRHQYQGIYMQNDTLSVIGNFSSFAAREKYIHLGQKATKSMPSNEEDTQASADSNCSDSIVVPLEESSG